MKKEYYLIGASLVIASVYFITKKLKESTLDGILERAMNEGLDKETFRIVREFRERINSGEINPLQARGHLNGLLPIGLLEQGFEEGMICQPYPSLRVDDDGFVYLKKIS